MLKGLREQQSVAGLPPIPAEVTQALKFGPHFRLLGNVFFFFLGLFNNCCMTEAVPASPSKKVSIELL